MKIDSSDGISVECDLFYVCRNVRLDEDLGSDTFGG